MLRYFLSAISRRKEIGNEIKYDLMISWLNILFSKRLVALLM